MESRVYSNQAVSPFVGTQVVAKFFLSKTPSGDWACISRTLGKFAIIHNDYVNMVNHKELWLCEILKEMRPGTNNGAFLLKPIKKLKDDQIRKLIPGYYTIKQIDNSAIFYPNNEPWDYWIISRGTRQIYSRSFYSIIVPVREDLRPPELTNEAEAQTEAVAQTEKGSI